MSFCARHARRGGAVGQSDFVRDLITILSAPFQVAVKAALVR